MGELKTTQDKQQASPYATGFFIKVDTISYLVTAKHVVVNPETNKIQDDVMVFYNMKDNAQVKAISVKNLKERYGTQWVFHPEEKVDIAVIPFPIDKQKDDILVIPDTLFLSVENLSELYAIFFLSYQPGVIEESRINPITRTGIVSRINEDLSFYIDAPAFPGNSGSPVFVTPSSWRFEGDKLVLKDSIPGKFVGIIGEYLPYNDIAVSVQTGKPRVIFEENTGISKVWSVNHLLQIIKSPSFNTQLSYIKNKIQEEHQKPNP